MLFFYLDDKNGTEAKLLKDTDCDDEAQSGCACERWLFVVIFMPVLLIISLFGFIAWIIIWPGECNGKILEYFTAIPSCTEAVLKKNY